MSFMLAQAAQPGHVTSADVSRQHPISGGMKGGKMETDMSVSLQGLIDQLQRSYQLDDAIHDLLRRGKKWEAFRALYKTMMPEIMGRGGDRYGIDPYIIDWIPQFTPIEYEAWQSIRALGLPLYPQFPVGNVFVDFGDPVKKIALECDGKDWHDASKDLARDKELFKSGWIVFRVTGGECKKPDIELDDFTDDFELSEAAEKWASSTSDGVISAIGWKFYGKRRHNALEQCFEDSLLTHSSFYSKAC